jgi:hypothetical protein
LTIWASLDERILAINDCNSKTEIEELKKEIVGHTTPFADLLQSLNAVVGDINRVKKARASAAQPAASAAVTSRKGVGALPATLPQINLIFGDLRSSCNEVKSVRWEESKASQAQRPFKAILANPDSTNDGEGAVVAAVLSLPGFG